MGRIRIVVSLGDEKATGQVEDPGFDPCPLTYSDEDDE